MAGVLPDGQRNLAFGLYYAGYGVGWLIGESIAQMLGARRTTVTLIARRLQFAGLIRYRRGRIIILDKVGLEQLACECYRTIRRQTERVVPPGPAHLVEFRTAEGGDRDFQAKMPYGLVVPDVKAD